MVWRRRWVVRWRWIQWRRWEFRWRRSKRKMVIRGHFPVLDVTDQAACHAEVGAETLRMKRR